MERLTALINTVKEKLDNRCTDADFFICLEALRNELNAMQTAVPDHTYTRVAVWMPAGYNRVEVPVSSPVTVPEESPVVTGVSPEQDYPFPETESAPATEVYARGEHPSIAGVPKPPAQPVQEFDATDETEDEDVFLLPGNINVRLPRQEPENYGMEKPYLPVQQAEYEADKPIVFELKVEDEPLQIPTISLPRQGAFNFEETVETISETSDVKEETTRKTRELHEILAARVVAQPASASKTGTAPILAEKLGGSKITDLKKAFAINDRFRFINALFRGDDTLFDRAVKTINNFAVLQEAQYWIQRELVIKLGWNEEDELVQQFYALVSRRFL